MCFNILKSLMNPHLSSSLMIGYSTLIIWFQNTEPRAVPSSYLILAKNMRSVDPISQIKSCLWYCHTYRFISYLKCTSSSLKMSHRSKFHIEWSMLKEFVSPLSLAEWYFTTLYHLITITIISYPSLFFVDHHDISQVPVAFMFI